MRVVTASPRPAATCAPEAGPDGKLDNTASGVLQLANAPLNQAWGTTNEGIAMQDIVFSVGEGVCSLFELSGGAGVCPTRAGTVVVGYVVFAVLGLALFIAALKLRA
jgi:hypothetical protein